MPPIYHLNHPPHPFWGFVQEMNDHPLWGRTAPPPPHPSSQQPDQQPDTSRSTAAEPQEKNQQLPADDPPEVDPSTLPQGEACKHARRCARRCGRDHPRAHHEGPRRGAWPPFGGPFGGPFGAPFGGPFGGPHHHHPPPPPPPFGFHGRGEHPHRGGPHHGGPRGRHHHAPPPPPPEGPGFNLGTFLNDLGNRIGVDLHGAAEGLGMDRFMPSSTSPDVDFEPKVDIFDLAAEFVIHVSLPGARKDDVGVDWDGEHSILRIAGVVHRPDADEELLQRLVVDGRKREVGVFEKNIRLGTRRDPANIDIAGIKAKMTDGVLVVRVPKVEKEHHKRDVPISSATPSPPRYEQPPAWEDEDMYDDAATHIDAQHPVLEPQAPHVSRTVSLEPQPQSDAFDEKRWAEQEPAEAKGKAKEVEAEAEREQTQTPALPTKEALPAYQSTKPAADHDWEEFGSDEEGEYVKINVD